MRMHPSTLLARLGLALMLVASMGAMCGDDANTLEGSIDQNFSLEFDRTQLQTIGSAMRLEYIKDLESGSEDIVARVVFDIPEGGIVADEEIDVLTNNGVIQRVTSDGDDFPEAELCTITFSEGGNSVGEVARGRFVTTFDNGKTLNGNFEATLEEL